MLSRRLLRMKVLQALYAFYQSDEGSIARQEKELFLSLDRIYELYIYLLKIGAELTFISRNKLEEAKNKRLPSEEDLNPNFRFVDNPVFKAFEENAELNKLARDRSIDWSAEQELIQKLFKKLKSESFYQEYMNAENSEELHKKFVVKFYSVFIQNEDLVLSSFQERSIHWNEEDFNYIISIICKNVKAMDLTVPFKPSPMLKDKDDELFVKNLFRKTISNNEQLEKMINEKTQNWDVERIAMMDILIMKMAITELMEFSSIPVKVSLNEYIDLAKSFSSPKSGLFVNGILDKLVIELLEKKLIVKTGRGLMS